MLDPHIKAMLDAGRAAGAPGLEAMTREQARALILQVSGAGDPNAPSGVESRDLTVAGAEGPLPARLYRPAMAAEMGPGIVFFHGGGFVFGDLDTHDELCRRLAHGSGLKLLAVDYRLAPEHPFPAAHDDAEAALRWVFDHARDIGFDPKRVAVAGDSAGGNLAAAVALAVRGDAGYPVAFQMLLYPWLQFTEETPSLSANGEGYFLTRAALDFFAHAIFGETGRRDDARIDLLHRPDLQGLPPAFIAVAGYDPLADEAMLYAERLTAAGVAVEERRYPALIHAFCNLAGVSPAVQPAIEDAAAALRRALAGPE